MFDTVIKNGKIVTAYETIQADIGIAGEKIAAIGQHLNGKQVIDATGKLVTPGAVDIHVHLEMPIGRFISTDDFYTGTRAAAFGGTTCIVDFVERKPDETMVQAIAARRALADAKTVIDYSLHMTLGPHEISILDQVTEAYAAGCTSFKLYMAYGLRLNDGELWQALTAVHHTNGIPVVHAENWDIICTLVTQNLAAGRTAPRWHPRSRPAAMEAEATGRVIDIAAMVGTPIHIFHASCDATVQRIAAARQKGLPVTGETCPQYLFQTWDAYDVPGVDGALPVCSPPIRSQQEQDALWQALSCGDLQMVTTDHCPFTQEEKATGLSDYSQIPGGVPSIEMRFAGIYQGVHSGLLTPNQWVDLCCTTPAKTIGLSNKGHIGIGYDADIVIFDPNDTFTITPDSLHESVGWTLYDGVKFRGRPTLTMSRGDVIVENEAFLGKKGRGQFIKRT